jgi:alkylresorcinol/alkylpyrone synthase
VATTITGMMAPSLEAIMMNRFPFPTDLLRTPIFGLGCLGGVASLNRAHEFLKSRPDKLAIVMAHEACSLTFQFNDSSMANMVGSSLFGDGAAVVLLAGENHPLYKKSGLVINETRASFYPNTESIMGWEVVDTGFKIVLSGSVPDMVYNNVAQDLKNINYTPENFSFVISHPGGPKVLEALAKVTEKSRDDFRFSWESLFENGNMSSVSVLNVLEKNLALGKKSGEQGLMMAMGPAFNSEMSLVTWE